MMKVQEDFNVVVSSKVEIVYNDSSRVFNRKFAFLPVYHTSTPNPSPLPPSQHLFRSTSIPFTIKKNQSDLQTNFIYQLNFRFHLKSLTINSIKSKTTFTPRTFREGALTQFATHKLTSFNIIFW